MVHHVHGEKKEMGSENSENQGNGIIWDQCFSSVEENPVVPQAFGIKIGVIALSFWDQKSKFLGS